MSCVLEILSLHELNTRKEQLLKQIAKIDIEIQKRIEKKRLTEKTCFENDLSESQIENNVENIEKIILKEQTSKSFRIKINISKLTKSNNCENMSKLNETSLKEDHSPKKIKIKLKAK